MRRFFDTNVITYILKQLPRVTNAIDKMVSNGDDLYIPSIAYYETKRWLVISHSGRKLSIFDAMLNVFPVVPMTMDTYDIAASIYADLSKKGSIIEDTDILIAASTIEHGAVLLTNNIVHFERVRGIKCETIS